MVRIFLTGYMGAGKTTLGKAFARKMNVPFVDLDWYIEERFHKTVGELFTERGETGFRELERNMLHEVAEFENVVISTGGGAPCFFDNMEFMNRVGKTVFLDVHPDVLFRRLRIAKQQRPILQGKEDDELKAFIIGRWNNGLLSTRRRNIFSMPTNWKIAGRSKQPCNDCRNCWDYKLFYFHKSCQPHGFFLFFLSALYLFGFSFLFIQSIFVPWHSLRDFSIDY